MGLSRGETIPECTPKVSIYSVPQLKAR